MSDNKIDVGDAVKIYNTFRRADTSALIDPSVVTLQIKTGSGSTVTYTYAVDAQVIRGSEGYYYVEYVPIIDGWHYYKWHGSGNMDAVEEGKFKVETSQIS